MYSLGCVLYEMLVGDPPYTASSTPAVLAKILMEEVTAPRKTRRSIPANIDAAIRKALEKLPADRFRTVHEFATALQDPGFRHTEDAGGARPGLWNPLSVTLGGLAAMLALALGWSTLGHTAPTPPLPVSRQVISAAPAAPLVTSRVGDVAISRDGRTVVYQTAIEPGRLAVRPIDRLTSTTFPGLGGGERPFLSPDGLSLGFQAHPGGPLQRVSIQGGPPQTIVDLPLNLTGASWGPDDQIVFSVAGLEGLYQVLASGGNAIRLTETDGSVAHQYPDVLPNGAGVLFTIDSDPAAAADNQIAVLDLRTGDTRVIIPAGTGARYAVTGHILYALGDSLMAVAFDPERLEATGEPVLVQAGVLARANGLADFDMSETGSLVFVLGTPRPGPHRTLVWVDREGHEDPLPLPADPYAFPRVSPDGTRIAVSILSGEAETGPLWVFDVGTGIGQRLTQRSARGPVWVSNDRLAFAASNGSTVQTFAVAANGSAPAALLPTDDDVENIIGDFPASATPDGSTLIFIRLVTAAHRAILRVPLQGDPAVETLIDDGVSQFGSAKVSPDGRWLTYWTNRSGQMEVYIAPYRRPGPPVPVSLGGGTDAIWSPDGTELFYRLDDRVMAVSFDGRGTTPRVGRSTELFRGTYVAPPQPGNTSEYDVAPDGRFLMLEEVPGLDADSAPAPKVVLVQNFFEELKRLVPR